MWDIPRLTLTPFRPLSGDIWTNGGVIRLITKEDPDPSHWKTSTVISGIGPVTSGIARLQDRKNHKLWLYFGSGRYFYALDDPGSRRYLVGVKDPCYQTNDTFNKACADSSPAALTLGSLKVQDSASNCDPNDNGWYITLDAQSVSSGAERSISDPVARTNGSVLFTTFKPTADVCKFGGDSYVWSVKYDTGCAPPAAALDSKILIQASTGSFEEITLRSALTDKDNRRQGTPFVGKPPLEPSPVTTNANNKPPKKILHLQEK